MTVGVSTDFLRLAAMVSATFFGCAPALVGQWLWPTPNKAFAEARPYEDFVQPTVSGLTVSALFGCSRSDGRQFHEGLDLKPIERDGRGEAADPVFSVLPGIVVHASPKAGASSYGRYLVIEHRGQRPALVSLYAHLLSIDPSARVGAGVGGGQVVAVMGRSAGGYSIPRDRAHLHFEVGVYLSQRFQQWYDGRGFGSPNEHGWFNGMNIVGLDFLDFAERLRAKQVRDVGEYIARQPVALTVFVRSAFEPDFVRRYPELVDGGAAAVDSAAGWEIDFTWYGFPKAWRRVSSDEVSRRPAGKYAIVFHDAALLGRYPCQSMVRTRGGRPALGTRAQDALDILFTGS
jgi:hypothetical protein